MGVSVGGSVGEAEQVSRLTLQFAAQGGERREAHGLRSIVLEFRQVHERHVHPSGKFSQRHLVVLQQVVEMTHNAMGLLDGHLQTTSSRSFRMSTP